MLTSSIATFVGLPLLTPVQDVTKLTSTDDVAAVNEYENAGLVYDVVSVFRLLHTPVAEQIFNVQVPEPVLLAYALIV
jgi:hypothetical protein